MTIDKLQSPQAPPHEEVVSRNVSCHQKASRIKLMLEKSALCSAVHVYDDRIIIVWKDSEDSVVEYKDDRFEEKMSRIIGYMQNMNHIENIWTTR